MRRFDTINDAVQYSRALDVTTVVVVADLGAAMESLIAELEDDEEYGYNRRDSNHGLGSGAIEFWAYNNDEARNRMEFMVFVEQKQDGNE
jgi:hypothetical protein